MRERNMNRNGSIMTHKASERTGKSQRDAISDVLCSQPSNKCANLAEKFTPRRSNLDLFGLDGPVSPTASPTRTRN